MAKKHVNTRGIKLKKNLLVDRRRDLGMSQSAVSDKAEVSSLTIWRAENGLGIDPENAKKIAAVLGVELSDLREPERRRTA